MNLIQNRVLKRVHSCVQHSAEALVHSRCASTMQEMLIVKLVTAVKRSSWQ